MMTLNSPKKILLFSIGVLTIGLIAGMGIGKTFRPSTDAEMTILSQEEDSTNVLVQDYFLSDWEVMILAIAKTESDFNFLARGSRNDLGLLQATEIWVEDVNRIIGEQRYSHCDALDPVKTLEMFSIIQNHYNPDKEVTRAIHLHNPGGDAIGYSVRVRNNIEWVKRYEKVRQLVHTH